MRNGENLANALKTGTDANQALVTGRERSSSTDATDQASSCFSVAGPLQVHRVTRADYACERIHTLSISLHVLTRSRLCALCVFCMSGVTLGVTCICSDRNARTRIVGYKRTCVSPPAPLPLLSQTAPSPTSFYYFPPHPPNQPAPPTPTNWYVY